MLIILAFFPLVKRTPRNFYYRHLWPNSLIITMLASPLFCQTWPAVARSLRLLCSIAKIITNLGFSPRSVYLNQYWVWVTLTWFQQNLNGYLEDKDKAIAPPKSTVDNAVHRWRRWQSSRRCKTPPTSAGKHHRDKTAPPELPEHRAGRRRSQWQ